MLTRVLTGVLAGGVALAALLWGEPWGIGLLLLAVVVLCTIEIQRLTRTHWLQAVLSTCAPFAFALVWPYVWSVADVVALVFWPISVLSFVLWRPNRVLARSGLYCLAPVASLCAFALWERAPEGGAVNLLVLAWLPLWAGDTFAFLVGKNWGRRPLAPKISPNKTVEGAVANLAGCLLASWGLGTWLGVPTSAWLAVGLTTGIVGQAGDLLQSRFKRSVGAKDSGSWLPGHGGVFDRLDSFLFSVYPSLVALNLLAP